MASFECMRTKALAHLEMMRPYTVWYPGLAAIAGIELASFGRAAPWRVILVAVVTMCGWVAGLYAGDYYDREIDARSKPTRPVPSGRVSPRAAFASMVALIVVGYLAALALGRANLVLAVAATALGIGYSKTFKSRAILGNFDRGVLGASAVFFGALAGGGVSRASVLLVAGLVCFHDSATNLVGALRDTEGDRAAGCTTVPVVYGLAPAVTIALALSCAGTLCGLAALATLPTDPLALSLFGVAVMLAAAVYVPLWLARQRVSRPAALRAHKVLVVERLLLMSAYIALYVPPTVALGLLAGAVAITTGAQALLRDRSERQQIGSPSPRAQAGGL